MPPKRVAIIGAALDLGAGRRGVDMGPSAIRYAGLSDRLEGAGIEVEDHGNVEAALAETQPSGAERARFLDEILETCARIAGEVEQARREGRVPLVLGGDHSIAHRHAERSRRLRDRRSSLARRARRPEHARTTPRGTCTGCRSRPRSGSAATRSPATGYGYRRSIRSVSRSSASARSTRANRRSCESSDIAVYTISDLDRRGVEPVIAEALERVAGGSFVHVSVDLDVVDPEFAPGVGDPVRGGLSYREAHLALELVAEAGVLDSLEMVEVNPIRDHENTTAGLAVELAASALGVRIL